MTELWPSLEQWQALELRFRGGAIGQFGQRDIDWQETVTRPETPEDMALDIAYVILNSGMKWAVAIKLWPRIREAIEADKPADEIPFGHIPKRNAMRWVWERRAKLFTDLQATSDERLIDWCRKLPWIGPITCYHVAKNWGAQVAKPDVWLVRAGERTGETAQQLCERISAMSGLKVPTVDLIIWAALSQGALTLGEIGMPSVPNQGEERGHG